MLYLNNNEGLNIAKLFKIFKMLLGNKDEINEEHCRDYFIWESGESGDR